MAEKFDDSKFHRLLSTRVDDALFATIAADSAKYGLSYSDTVRLRLRSGYVQAPTEARKEEGLMATPEEIAEAQQRMAIKAARRKSSGSFAKIHRNPSRLIFAEQLGRGSPSPLT